MMAVSAVFKIPAFVFGAVITGWGALAVYSAFTVAQLYLGSGILQLQEHARIGGIAYFCFCALNSLTVTLTGWDSKMGILKREVPKLFPAGVPASMPQPAWIFGVMGTAFVAIPVWFLIRRRTAFTHAAV